MILIFRYTGAKPKIFKPFCNWIEKEEEEEEEEMLCAYISSWVWTGQSPVIRAPNSEPKLSISRTAPPALGGRCDHGESSSMELPVPAQVKPITSTSNPFVKHCLKLRLSSSYRHSHGSALVVGTTPIRSPAIPIPILLCGIGCSY